jgi:hypothetical protein
MFVINQYGYYFEIDSSLDADLKAFHGCLFFDTEKAMLEKVCEQQDLQMDEVSGTTCLVKEKYGTVHLLPERNCEEEVEGESFEAFISEYRD